MSITLFLSVPRLFLRVKKKLDFLWAVFYNILK